MSAVARAEGVSPSRPNLAARCLRIAPDSVMRSLASSSIKYGRFGKASWGGAASSAEAAIVGSSARPSPHAIDRSSPSHLERVLLREPALALRLLVHDVVLARGRVMMGSASKRFPPSPRRASAVRAYAPVLLSCPTTHQLRARKRAHDPDRCGEAPDIPVAQVQLRRHIRPAPPAAGTARRGTAAADRSLFPFRAPRRPPASPPAARTRGPFPRPAALVPGENGTLARSLAPPLPAAHFTPSHSLP